MPPKYTFSYGVFHWFIHYVFSSLLVAKSNFYLIDIFIPIPSYLASFLGIPNNQLNIVDYFLVAVATSLIDLDHLLVFKKFGKRGIFSFAQYRIAYPLHNFLFFSVFSFLAAIAFVFRLRIIGVLLLAPVIHILWDMFEDAIIFKTRFKKWTKTWGISSKELEEIWKELEGK